MNRSVFTIDGVEYPNIHVLSLKRAFSVLDGNNAGRTMDGNMRRDIIGTYYNYSLEIAPEESSPEEYDALYEVLSAPEDSHEVSFPYGRGILSFQAYISNGEDGLFDQFGGVPRWNNLTINFIAMLPQRRPL